MLSVPENVSYQCKYCSSKTPSSGTSSSLLVMGFPRRHQTNNLYQLSKNVNLNILYVINPTFYNKTILQQSNGDSFLFTNSFERRHQPLWIIFPVNTMPFPGGLCLLSRDPKWEMMLLSGYIQRQDDGTLTVFNKGKHTSFHVHVCYRLHSVVCDIVLPVVMVTCSIRFIQQEWKRVSLWFWGPW